MFRNSECLTGVCQMMINEGEFECGYSLHCCKVIIHACTAAVRSTRCSHCA